MIEEEYCRDVTRPVCVTRTELECGGDTPQQQTAGNNNNNNNNNNPPQQQPFNPSNVPVVTSFDGTGVIGGFGRNSPATSRRRDDSDDEEGVEETAVEGLFLSTGMFQRSSKDRVKRPKIVPRRFKKNASSRQDSGDEDSGSLEEVFLSTGVFQRGENDTVQRQRAGGEELRRHRRQVSGQSAHAV